LGVDVPTLESPYFATFDLLPDAILVADEQGTIRFANRAAAQLLGWPADELRGRPLTIIMPQRMHLAHEAGLRRYAATHHSRIMGRPIRVPALRRDGTEVDVELTLASVSLEPDRELVLGTLRDLTDRVELERQLRVVGHMRTVTAAAAHFTSLLDVDRVVALAAETLVSQFDAALARIWLKEPQGKTLRLRSSAGLSQRIAGSSRERIDIASHPFKIGLVARTRRPYAKNDLSGDPQFDQEWVAREGLEAATAFPLLVANDLQGVLVAFFRHTIDEDLFEVLAMLAAMVATAVNDADLYARAQRALRARDEVLAVVSHDLRGPLSVIEMGTNTLLRGDERREDVVLRLRRAGRRMQVLIRDLLDVSAIEAGRLRMEPAAQAVGPLVSEALEQVRPLAEEKHIGLTADVAIPTARLVCDRGRIVQVFANLLGNAIKFTNDGGSVTVKVVEDGDTVRFGVTDTGCGISEDQLPHVFDRYWQGGRSGAGGVGLGLAIARGIVEAHHGTIHAESTRGQGSTFVFDLPRGA
jgi:PAS domain S-box-containing protein